jgi:hypothetical protein
VFSIPAAHALSPHPETGLFAIQAHEFDDLFFFQAKLEFDCLKGRTIFPSHLDDSVDVLVGKLIYYVCTFHHSR